VLSPTASGFPRRLEALASGPLLVVLLVVYLPFYGLYFRSDLPFSLPYAKAACQGLPVLDTRWGYSPDVAYRYLTACGAAGRAAVRNQQLADVLYPVLYSLVLSGVMLLVLKHWAPRATALSLVVLVPLATWALDYMENAGVWTLLLTFPTRLDGLIRVMSVVTVVKQALGFVSVALTGILLVAFLIHRASMRWVKLKPTG
jgi:hypothetical protein